MYQPPPGRPVSSPPDYLAVVNGSMPKRTKRRWRHMPDDVRQAIRADYTAGMAYEDIKRKNGLTGNGALQRAIADLPKRNPRKMQPPIRMEGETPVAYARRRKAWLYANDPAMRERQAEAMRAAWAKRKRKAAAAKRKVEKESAKPAVHVLADLNNAHIDRPEDHIGLHRVAPRPVVSPVAVAAPPPTLWQRITGWFR